MSDQTKNSQKKGTNPLYVVRGNGVDVEEAQNYFDLLLKKMGIDQIIAFLESLLHTLFSTVSSYPMFLQMKQVYDAYFNKAIELIFLAQQFLQKGHSKI